MAAAGDPFVDAGMWLRCALHAHTTRSDGELEPDELVRHYEAAEFDVLAITDHWIRTEADSTDRLLVIPSSELSCRLPDEADGHLLAFGIDEDPLEFVRTRPDLAASAAWVGEHGGVAYLAHLLHDFHGNKRLALAGWYQGELAVRKHGVYKVSRTFVKDVLSLEKRM